MKRKDIVALAAKDDSQIRLCKVVKHTDEGITFLVDEGLSKPAFHFSPKKGRSVAIDIIRNQRKEVKDEDIIKCSFDDGELNYYSKDTLYFCFVTAYGEHYPLVISPDVIWTVICQTLATHILSDSEKYRSKIVRHEGKLDIIVESPFPLDNPNVDWKRILDGFYSQIADKTLNGIADKMVADFSTTGQDERIASVATLMHGVEAYFNFHVHHIICGIPYVTLKGSYEDWRHLLEKAAVLKEYGMSNWYSWIEPILKEFTRAASGKPHLDFWKSTVQVARDEDFSPGRGCSGGPSIVDGWCVALFPYRDDVTERTRYDQSYSSQRMASETVRVGFKYKEIYPDGSITEESMELWSGIVGFEQEKETFALIPKIGWFVHRTHEMEEMLKRLIQANDSLFGIDLDVDEVPQILQKLDVINKLMLRFEGNINLPEWFFTLNIQELRLMGSATEEYKELIRSYFPNVEFY